MKSLRTTLAGMLGAGATVALSYLQTGIVEPKTLAIAASLGAIGFLAKDHNGKE